jgi:hypothetical protein
MMLVASRDWSIEAKIIPLIVGSSAMLFCSLSLANDVFGRPADTAARDAAGPGWLQKIDRDQKIHMDIASRLGHLLTGIKLARGAAFFGWLVAFLCSMAAIGLIATAPIFAICYMRFEGREPWSLTAPMAGGSDDALHIWLVRPGSRHPVAADAARHGAAALKAVPGV